MMAELRLPFAYAANLSSVLDPPGATLSANRLGLIIVPAPSGQELLLRYNVISSI